VFKKSSSIKFILEGITSVLFVKINIKIIINCMKNLFFGEDKIFKSELTPNKKIKKNTREKIG
tara:strand:+ start:202 stop:390 length:189 start_codon:yes stop_codon:yes gene_type:complete